MNSGRSSLNQTKSMLRITPSRILLLVAILAALALNPLHTQNAIHAQTESPAILPAPTLTAASSGATAIEVSWSSVSGADRYRLWVWWDSDTGWQRLDDGNFAGTSHIHPSLTAGRTYYYVVVAVDSNGEQGALSEQVSLTLPQSSQTLAAPVLTAESTEATTVQVSWTPVSDAVSYELWAWWSSDTGWQPLVDRSLTVTSFTHTELTAGRTYYYIAVAVDSNGNQGVWSEQVSVTLSGASQALGAPILTVASTGATTVEVSWTSVSGAVTYQLWSWWNSDTGWQRLDDSSLTDTSFTDTEVTAGVTYYYIVAAVDSNADRGALSEQVSVTVPGMSQSLEAPTLTAATPLTTTVDLSWTLVSGAASYELWAWWDITTGWQQLDDGSLTDTAYAHTEVTAGLTYYYLVAAVDTNDERGAWSEQLSVTVPDSMTVLDAPAERAALVALYEAADGVNWTQNDNWSTAASISTWYGVTTDESGLVVELLLSGNGLSGLLPDLSALTNLTILDLSYNQLSGPIPDLSALTNLRNLFLSDNQLTGSIPDLVALTKLTTLDLGFNQLTGSFPGLSAPTDLTSLSLGSNQLSGPLPDLSALTSLTDLDLTSNQFTGSIPDLSVLSNLGELYLGSNQFSGSIPDLGTLTNLTWLDLSHNDLTGLPQNLGALTNLRWLSLSYNQLTGSIPDLSPLTNLTWLDLGHNQLTGSIPNLGALTRLTNLSLHSNQLDGSIPDMSALTNLTSLSLGSNRLSGTIQNLSTLTNLTSLSLASNQLSGSIPALNTLTNLTDLDLGSNQLTGSIPVLSALTDLTILTLGSNQLTGPVPDLSALTKLTSLDLSANQQLCLPGGYGFSGLTGAVTAHLQSLNLPTCAAS